MKKRTECSAICGDCGSRAEEENAGMRTGAAVRAAFTVCLAVLLLLCGAGAVSAAPSGYWTDHAANDYAGGDGSETNPYNISRPEEFALFAKQVNANLNTTQNFTLTSNIDLSAYLWEPIGNVTTNNPTTHIFQGTFDGGNHTISNMNVTKVVGSDCIYAGLFGCVKDATIKNMTLTGVVVNVTLSGDACSGGLVGNARGSITNCCVTGNASASGHYVYSGDLAGYASNSSTTNSTALNPWVNATGDSSLNIGRAVGQLWTGATVSDCYAWRHMCLNISSTITKSADNPNDKNATNASTVMIWDNETFFQRLFGEANFNANWTLTNTPEKYKLPILRWQTVAPAAGASHLNLTHSLPTTKTGDGTITQNPQRNGISDGASVTFTLAPEENFLSLIDNRIGQTVSGNIYAISDVDRSHEIVATFKEAPPVPPVPPIPAGDSDGNMDNAYRVLFETFGGWFTDEACTKAWDFTSGIPGDMTLYANWIAAVLAAPAADTQAAKTTETATATATAKTTATPEVTPAVAEASVPAAEPALILALAPVCGALLGLLAAVALLLWRE